MVTSLLYSGPGVPRRTVTSSNSASESYPALGISLSLSINSTRLKSGESIAFIIKEENTRIFPNEVRAVDQWAVKRLTLGPCGTVNRPFGYAMFLGKYGNDNVSSAAPLQLYPSSVYYCPLILIPRSYSFDPISDLAGVNGFCNPNPCFQLPLENRDDVAGTYAGVYTTDSRSAAANFHYFLPGSYTLAAGDEWGDLLLLHFTVA